MFHFKSYISVFILLYFILITVLNAQETTNIIIRNDIKDAYFNVEIARKKIDKMGINNFMTGFFLINR